MFTLNEKRLLKEFGFNWDAEDTEWYKDTCERPQHIFLGNYIDGKRAITFMTTHWDDKETKWAEDYEHFLTIEELLANIN